MRLELLNTNLNGMPYFNKRIYTPTLLIMASQQIFLDIKSMLSYIVDIFILLIINLRKDI